MASKIRSRNQSNGWYDDWHRGSSTEADEDAYRLYAEFNCTSIPTPRIFHDYSRSSTEIEAALGDLIGRISSINRKGNIGKSDGSFISCAGGISGIAGTVAAPFTFGGSLLLAGIGIAMSIGGSSESSKAETKMASEMKSRLQEAQAHLEKYNTLFLKWTVVAQLLNEIVEDLQDVFNELDFSFGNLVEYIGNVTYDDRSSNGVECILKCVSTFYGVAKQSTHVVKEFEHITRLTLRVRQVRTLLHAGKKAGEVLNAAKGGCLRVVIGKPQVAFTATKNVLTNGRQVISTAEKATKVSKSVKLVSIAADGTGNVVKTERAIQAVGTSITKETAMVTKTVSRLGLALGVVFTVVDAYQCIQALSASASTCDAEKDLRSCKENIKERTNEILDQEATYKQVMKIKAFFQFLLHNNKPFLFGNVSMPLEQVRACIDKIDTLCEMMS